MLASVSAGANTRYQFEELSTSYIYCLVLSQVKGNEFGFDAYLNILPRRSPDPKTCSLSPYAEPSKVNRDLPPSEGFTRVEALQNVPEHLVEAVDSLINHLDRSVMLRTMNVPHYDHPAEKGRAKVAVLFSGGIDSTMVAFFAHKHAPTDEPIDLLNVAFENPIKIKRRAHGNIKGLNKKQKDFLERNSDMMKHATNPGSLYMVPDRETGLEEVEELRKLCPERVWNFVEINVPYSESQAARPKIEALIFPRRTVMDMSLALALYFAAKGQGQIRPLPEAEPIPYRSQARVLLNGLGSDELLGGYGRHRSAFNTGGWECAIEELQLELDRIPTRNLGRDDRVISSQGKETRHPFLSLTLVDFLVRLPIHFKMDPRLELGVGDKMLLRLAARKLGLVGASERKKRAMQFGTHSARMDGERRGDALLD